MDIPNQKIKKQTNKYLLSRLLFFIFATLTFNNCMGVIEFARVHNSNIISVKGSLDIPISNISKLFSKF